jgi:hypothetical protein
MSIFFTNLNIKPLLKQKINLIRPYYEPHHIYRLKKKITKSHETISLNKYRRLYVNDTSRWATILAQLLYYVKEESENLEA